VAGSTYFERPHAPETSSVVYSRYPLRAKSKEEVIRRAMEAKIEVAAWYTTPVHPLEGRQLQAIGYEPGSCPRAEALCASLVSLPTNTKTDLDQARRICDFVRSFG
jgi:dTDP-4-amino-4,6-dideoxygalactose transaminase